jgi:hypothetical protein
MRKSITMRKTFRNLALLLAVLASLCAAATPGSVPLSSLQLNGWAQLMSYGSINLTNDNGQASSAFIPTPFTLGTNDSFSAFFVYQSQQEFGQCVADGLAFVVQSTAQGPGYLGEDGSGLGFFTGTASPALGVTFDYYANQITGTPPNAAAIATANGADLVWITPNPPALAGAGEYRYVWVTYQRLNRIMRVYYSATPTHPVTPLLQTAFQVDTSIFERPVYFGITAGTGSCYSHQDLISLWLDVQNAPN